MGSRARGCCRGRRRQVGRDGRGASGRYLPGCGAGARAGEVARVEWQVTTRLVFGEFSGLSVRP